MPNHIYGWKRDRSDVRDRVYRATYEALPKLVDLRPDAPPCYDQGQLGSCTANAIAGAIAKVAPVPFHDLTPSRLFVYFNERDLEGTTDQDAGATIRDGIKVVNRYGVCGEDIWPYDISKFTVRPPGAAYQNATLHQAIGYQAVSQTLYDIKHALSKTDTKDFLPVVFGMMVYESFESQEVAKTGIVKDPELGGAVGGHAMVLYGYNDDAGMFLCRNSWGPTWGMDGYCWLPYEWITGDQCSDFWAISQVGSLQAPKG